jgi:hypothetical protein
MYLPRSLRFSATSLQDYVDCARRFQLRYLLQVAWPVPEAEPIGERERHARLARDFHRLVHQHLLGLPADTLSASIHDSDLERWWQAYLAYLPAFEDAQAIPEVSLSIPSSGYRVVAQYDAIVFDDRRVPKRREVTGTAAADRSPLLIIDWKTYRQRPSRAWLARRLQTRVYPVVLVQAGASLLGQTHIEPGDVEMCYWLTEYPHTPETFPYDAAAFQADLEFLSALISEIDERIKSCEHGPGTDLTSATDDVWPLTSELKRCRFCSYRSLCGRGGVAGPLVEFVEGDDQDQVSADEIGRDFDLDWGQVQEIAY